MVFTRIGRLTELLANRAARRACAGADVGIAEQIAEATCSAAPVTSCTVATTAGPNRAATTLATVDTVGMNANPAAQPLWSSEITSSTKAGLISSCPVVGLVAQDARASPAGTIAVLARKVRRESMAVSFRVEFSRQPWPNQSWGSDPPLTPPGVGWTKATRWTSLAPSSLHNGAR